MPSEVTISESLCSVCGARIGYYAMYEEDGEGGWKHAGVPNCPPTVDRVEVEAR